jgi:hypothetical protein
LAPTAQAAALVAAGRPATNVVSTEVMALAEGVVKAMLRTRLIFGAALLMLGVLGASVGAFALRAQGPQKPPPAGQAAPAQAAAEPDVYALLLVEPREPRLLPGGKRDEPAGDEAAYRRTQLVLLKSRLVLRAAVRRPEVAGLAALKEKADPLAWLEENLRAAFIDDTGVLRVSVARGSPADRAALTNAVVRAYLEEVVGREKNDKAQRWEELAALQTRYEDQLQHKRQQLRKMTEVRGASLSLKQQFDREDLTRFRAELQQVRLETIRAQARLNYLKRVGSADAKEVAKREEEVAVLEEQAKLLRAEIDPLARVVQAAAAAASDPELESVREEIAAGEQQVRKMAAEVEALKVEERAGPRVRLLEEASAGRPKK